MIVSCFLNSLSCFIFILCLNFFVKIAVVSKKIFNDRHLSFEGLKVKVNSTIFVHVLPRVFKVPGSTTYSLINNYNTCVPKEYIKSG